MNDFQAVTAKLLEQQLDNQRNQQLISNSASYGLELTDQVHDPSSVVGVYNGLEY